MNRGLYPLVHPLIPRRIWSWERAFPLDHPDSNYRIHRQYPPSNKAGPGILDHFDNRRRPLNWTLATANAVWDLNRTWKSHYYARFTAASGSFGISLPWAPAGDFSITAKIRALINNITGSQALVYASDGVNNAVYLNHQGSGGLASATPTMLTQDAGAFTQRGNPYTLTGSILYGHVQRIGTGWTVWFSSDGYSWMRIVSAHTKVMTVASVGVSINNGSGGYSGFEVGIDWVRLNWRIMS